MKPLNSKIKLLIALLSFAIVIAPTLESCISQKISDKPGSQLWAENCQHCHNSPNPGSFSSDQWETIGMHMQTRALITEKERDKIVEFLKQVAK
jgi:hypothetical protein